MNSNRDRLIYWTSTGIVCAVMVFSILSFTFYDRFPFPNGQEGAFAHLGLPACQRPRFRCSATSRSASSTSAVQPVW